MLAVLPLLELVCVVFLDGLATVNQSGIRHRNGIVGVERGHSSGIVFVEYLVKFFIIRLKLLA
jgi:hypothetical protein